MICLLGLLRELCAQEEEVGKSKLISLTINVVDEQNLAVAGAKVVVGSVIELETNEKGAVTMEARPDDMVKISSKGYADYEMVVGKLKNGQDVKLKTEILFVSSSDDVLLPFMTVKKRFSTSGSTMILGEELEKYPTNDIRNSFTGLVPGLQVQEMNGAPGLQAEEKLGLFGISEKIRLYSRGRSPVFIIDDVPTDVTEMQLDQQEIESATIIKDIADKAMYGPQAADGIIFIRTKHGKTNQHYLKVNTEIGMSTVDRFPKWVLGADYATLNNLARTNSKLAPLYTGSEIAAYAKNDANDMYHPSIDFRNLMLKDTKAFRKANISSTGGKEGVQYFTYLGYSNEGDIYKIGSTSDFNRINARSNLDIKINDYMKLHFNICGGLTFRRSPNYGYDAQYGSDTSTDGTMDIVEFNRMIGDITTTSPIAFPVYAGFDSFSKTPWYGVDPSFPINPIGELTSNGYYNESGRSGTSSIALDFDMSNILKGLKSKTFFSFDVFNLVRIGKAERYIAYNVTPSLTTAGKDTILLTKSHDGTDMAGQAKLHDYYYQRFGGYQSFSYDKKIGGDSYLQSSLTYILSTVSRNQVKEPERQQSVALAGIFTHKEKYSVEGVLNFSGSSSLAPQNRYNFFPSIGLGWVISEEDFLSGSKVINFLKLRGQAGILGFENFDPPYYYKDMWTYNTSGSSFGAASTGYWFGSDTESGLRSTPDRIGNLNIKWEKRKEFSVGIDALMFKQKLSLELNYYNNLRDGILTNLSYAVPYSTGIAFTNSYANINKIRYFGFEANIQYIDKVGKLHYSIGANATVQNSKILKFDEPNYRSDYQSRIGKPVDAFWGLTYLGNFANDAETQIVPQLFDEVLQSGDFKYKDLNNDRIVDDNDKSQVGHTSPRLIYALNLKLNYNNFDLTVITDGRAFVDLPLTGRYFQNGWGDSGYSEFVRDNMGVATPKLTYYQVNNNFQNSDFWLTNGGYFKIQNIELAYNFSSKAARFVFARNVKFFVRGANLLTITDVKDVDPESPNSGIEMYPLFRTFTGGINITF
jgi:TonB-linked SusC/RagA family outer membrane protein